MVLEHTMIQGDPLTFNKQEGSSSKKDGGTVANFVCRIQQQQHEQHLETFKLLLNEGLNLLKAKAC